VDSTAQTLLLLPTGIRGEGMDVFDEDLQALVLLKRREEEEGGGLGRKYVDANDSHGKGNGGTITGITLLPPPAAVGTTTTTTTTTASPLTLKSSTARGTRFTNVANACFCTCSSCVSGTRLTNDMVVVVVVVVVEVVLMGGSAFAAAGCCGLELSVVVVVVGGVAVVVVVVVIPGTL